MHTKIRTIVILMITKANIYFLFIVNLTCAQWFTLISITLVRSSGAQVIIIMFQVTLR